MPGRYKQKQKKNRSRFYILLSVVFIVVMFKWGLPLFMNIVAGNGGQRVETNKDIIPPQAPVISALPDATNSAYLSIEGFTEANANIELLMNDTVDKIDIASDNGSFLLNTTLVSGQNRVQLRARDQAGNESMSEVTLINYDSKPINLTVSFPKDGSEYFGKTSQVIDIKGEVDKSNTQVLVNNSFVQVAKDGSFLHRFMLSGGNNTIKITATDAAGNTAEKSLTIVYTP